MSRWESCARATNPMPSCICWPARAGGKGAAAAMNDERSMQALAAGVKTLRSGPRRALEVFRLATEDDAEMADAWLGRIAAGERSLMTLAALAGCAHRVGADQRAPRLNPTDLRAFFDVEYVGVHIVDEISAKLAYASALIDHREFTKASGQL